MVSCALMWTLFQTHLAKYPATLKQDPATENLIFIKEAATRMKKAWNEQIVATEQTKLIWELKDQINELFIGHLWKWVEDCVCLNTTLARGRYK